jgi:putative transposase
LTIEQHDVMNFLTPPEKPRKKRTRRPKHMLVGRAFRFALGPTEAQAQCLHAMLDALHGLRDTLTIELSDERRQNRARKAAGEHVSYMDRAALYRRTSALAEKDKALAAVHSHLRQNVAVRILEGTKRWLDALREDRPGVRPPRPIDRKRYRSFTFPEYGNGCRINNGKLLISGVGWVKLHDHRRIVGTKKTVTVKFAQGRWWASVIALVQVPDRWAPVPEGLPEAGGDPGLANLLTDSHGRVFDPPKALQEAQRDLKREQRVLSRKFEARKRTHAQLVAEANAKGERPPALRDLPYSSRLRAQFRVVGKRHAKVENTRNHHHKKIAAICADTLRRLACEDHSLQFMIRNRRLARAASDRAIGAFKGALASKLGPERFVLTPNQRPGIGGNSQTCLCGHSVPKSLTERVHRCEACGLEADRDHEAANIVQFIAFGTVSDTLEKHLPAGGQPVVRRGGSEGEAGASRSPGGRRHQPQPAVERPRRSAPLSRRPRQRGCGSYRARQDQSESRPRSTRDARCRLSRKAGAPHGSPLARARRSLYPADLQREKPAPFREREDVTHCLIVDDSRSIRKVSRQMLESLGFRVSEAENGEATLRVCRPDMPDVVLLDWNMPVMDGYSFLKQLRAFPEGLAPKVVFCTTENDMSFIARALEAGADEYIMKPFDKDILVAKLLEVGVLQALSGGVQ